MPHDLMNRCEERRQYVINGEREWRWKEVPVSLAIGASPNDIRCMHCHGAVRIHRQKVAHGPQDHVEYRSRQDSEGCKAGVHFNRLPKKSVMPSAIRC
jgi:hypothetical protein